MVEALRGATRFTKASTSTRYSMLLPTLGSLYIANDWTRYCVQDNASSDGSVNCVIYTEGRKLPLAVEQLARQESASIVCRVHVSIAQWAHCQGQDRAPAWLPSFARAARRGTCPE
jgi:hypothetical protein